MRILITICLGLCLFGLSFPVTSFAPRANAEVVKVLANPDEIKNYIQGQLSSAGLDPSFYLQIPSCESGFEPQQSQHLDPEGPNGRENSWGVWQINLKWNPSVTIEQAMDPVWSTNWAIKQIKSGFTKWSCWPKSSHD